MAQTPQIGTYTQEVSPQESLPRRTVPVLRPENYEQPFNVAAQAIERKQRADASIYAANRLSDFRVSQMQAFVDAKGQARPDGSGFTDDVLAEFDKNAAAVRKGADRFAAPMMDAAIRQFREHIAGESIQWQAAQNTAFKSDSIKRSTDNVAAVVEQDPSQYKPSAAVLMKAVNDSGFGPEGRLAHGRYVDSTLTLAAARGLARDNPQQVLSEINDPSKAGDIVGHLEPQQREAIRELANHRVVQMTGDGIVNTYRALGPKLGALAFGSIDKATIPDEQKDAIRQHVLTGLQQAEAESKQTNQQALIGLDERIHSGKPDPGDRALAWGLYGKLAFGPGELSSRLADIDKANEKNAVDTTNQRFVEQAIAEGRPLDVKSDAVKSGMADAFQASYGRLPPGSKDWINGASDFAKGTGVLPEPAVSWSRAQLVSGNPASAAQAAETLRRLMEASPRGAPFAIDEKTNVIAAEIIRMRAAGVPDVQAVNTARANANLPKPEKDRLEEDYRKLRPWLSAVSILTKQMNLSPEVNPHWFTAGAPPLPRAMTAEFSDLQHDFFLSTGGNLLQASQLAAESIKRDWSVETVNGQREFMKFGPLRMFPGQITNEIIRKDIENIVKSDPSVDASKVRLIESTGTNSTASTRGHVWNLGLPDNFGAYDLLVGERTGLPREYNLPVGITEKEALRQQMAGEAIKHTVDVQKIIKAQESGLAEQALEDLKARNPLVGALLGSK